MNTKRSRGEGRLFQRGKTWWIQYYHNGAQVRESAGTDDERVAAKLLRRRIGENAAGIHRDLRKLTYQDLRAAYLSDYELADRKSLRRGKDGNLYLEPVRRLDSFFEGYPAADVDADLVRKFQQELRAKGLENGTINRSVAALRRMFSIARRDGKLRNTPHFPMLPEAKPRQGTLPHESYGALLRELPAYLRPVTTVAFRTGMRLSEILNLKWSDVSWLDRIIRIADSKNNECREVPFSGELEAVLREQFAKRQDRCDRVCFRIDSLGQARPVGNNFRAQWQRACTRIGLGHMEPMLDENGRPKYKHAKPKMTYVGLIFHDLRRTFISDAEHSGAPRHEVMKISGHKTESTYKRYAIENREQRRAALAQIDEYRAQKLGDTSGPDSTEMQQETSVTQ